MLYANRDSDDILTQDSQLLQANRRGRMIELRALGTAEIQTDLAKITPSQQIVFAVALYLILERGKRISRAGLATLIWPNAPQASRTHRLRQTLLQLRRLGVSVRADRDALLLEKLDARADLDSFHNPVNPAHDVFLEFLPGYDPTFSNAFREWVDTRRSTFQSAALRVLLQELDAARIRGDWQSVDRIAGECLVLDAFNEAAVLGKAEAAAMRGSKRKAVSMLDKYLADIGELPGELRIPATILRRRVVERIPDRPELGNTDPAFVGREAEMTLLTTAFEKARGGKGSAPLVPGEPGIGKSRLSAELTRAAELRGARVQRATCRRSDIDRPLSLFVDIVPQLRELPGAIGCAPETFSWLKRLTEFDQHGGMPSRSMDADTLFDNVRAALFDLLDSITEEYCLVVLIEDLQWLDTASAKVLARMVEWSKNRRVLILLNSRPKHGTFLDYLEGLPVRLIALDPLSSRAATALLKSIAQGAGHEPEPEFVDWCLSVAEGNPFFLQELAHQWMETGLRYEAPPSVNKVMQERLSRLSPEALQVLQACAILNDYATIDRVERVLQHRPHQLLAAVEELSKSAMLGVGTDANVEMNDGLMQPRHDFLASAAVSRLSRVSLAFLHRRSADVLETDLAHPTVSTTLLWACATHRHHAGDRVRALSLSISCGEHLLELGLAHDACGAFKQTMDYCTTDLERLEVTSRLARALELDADWTASIAMLRVCMSLAVKSGSVDSTHNDYELAMLEARHRSALDYASLFEESLACVNSDAATPKHRVGAAVLALKLSVDFGRADYLDRIYAKVSPFLDSGEVNELHALQIRTIYRTSRGGDAVPLADLRRLADVARQVDGEFGYSRGLLMAATACRLSGRYLEGLAFVSAALEHANSKQFHSKRTEITLQQVTLHIAAREFDKAQELLTAVGEFPRSDSLKERSEIYAHLARVAIEQGDFDRAAHAFGQIELVSPDFSPSRVGYYVALELQIRLHRKDSHEVIQDLVTKLERTHRQLMATGSQDFEAITLFQGLCALNEREYATRLLTEYVGTRTVRGPLPNSFQTALKLPDNSAMQRDAPDLWAHARTTSGQCVPEKL